MTHQVDEYDDGRRCKQSGAARLRGRLTHEQQHLRHQLLRRPALQRAQAPMLQASTRRRSPTAMPTRMQLYQKRQKRQVLMSQQSHTNIEAEGTAIVAVMAMANQAIEMATAVVYMHQGRQPPTLSQACRRARQQATQI